MSQTKEQIKANISRNITTNGVGEITGEVMRRVLNNMTDNLGLEKDISDLQSSVEDLNENKVDKVPGKGLSTEDYTTEEKQKLAGIEAGAEVNVNADWDASSGDAQILNKPDLSVYATKASVEDIEALIPSQASESNQLADKEFVNSSISTNTAEFKGTYNSLAELEAVSANENDYGFVISTDASGNTVYNRYKYTNGAWLFEYALNNSSFTAAQWDAIQSGITSSLVTKLSALPTATELSNSLNNKVDKVAGKGLSTNDYTTAEKQKLAGIAEGAQVNVLEGVKVDGTELPITDKKVNIDLSGKVNVAEHQSQEDQSFVFRQTGGGDLTIDAKNAELTSIKGHTLVWNQMVRKFDGWGFIASAAEFGLTATYDEQTHIITINGTANNTGRITWLGVNSTMSGGFINGHKYYMRSILNKKGSSDTFFVREASGVTELYDYGDGVVGPANRDGSWYIALFVNEGAVLENVQILMQVVDLTMLFNGSVPSGFSAADFRVLFPEAYYPYNAGTPISNDASALETVGFNLWDEEWEEGSYDTSTGQKIAALSTIRSKNRIEVFPNTVYCINTNGLLFFYDANESYISYSGRGNDGTFTTPSNCRYVRFRISNDYGNTYNHDICINLSDASKNGTYEPYWKRRINLNLSTLKDKDGNLVFPYGGMNGVGTAFDMLKPDADGMIRVGTRAFKGVDLGSLVWSSGSVEGLFLATITGQKIVYAGYKPNDVCSKYIVGTTITSSANAEDKKIYQGNSNNYIFFKDIAFNGYSGAQVAEALSGVMLYYELATPVEYELAEPIPNFILVDELGTEQAIFPTHEDGSPSAPLRADISYSEAHVKYNEIEGMPDIINNLSDVMTSDASKVGSNGTVTTIISLTQSQYDALTSKDSNTVYIIKNS